MTIYNLLITAGDKAMETALIDNGGRTIRTQKVSGRTFDIQAADLPAGVYFVRLTDGRSSCIAKVVKR